MAFIRVKRRGDRAYAYLVESVWDPDAGRPRQRVIRYLGRADEVKPTDVPETYRGELAVRRWLRANVPQAKAVYEEDVEARRRRLLDLLLEGEDQGVGERVREDVARLGLGPFLDEVLTPLMVKLGEDWYAGRLTVADEHIVTRGVADALRDLRREARSSVGDRTRGGVVLLGNPPGERHSLGLSVLECRLAAAGHRTLVIAGGAPVRDFALRARQFDPDVVLVSATLEDNVAASVETADAVLRRCPHTRVLLGGRGWKDAGTPTELDRRVQVFHDADGAVAEETVGAIVAARRSGERPAA